MNHWHMQENSSMMISKHKESLDKINQKHSILFPKFSVLGFCCTMQSYIRDATWAFCKLLDVSPGQLQLPTLWTCNLIQLEMAATLAQ
jgi:hypothetical protein